MILGVLVAVELQWLSVPLMVPLMVADESAVAVLPTLDGQEETGPLLLWNLMTATVMAEAVMALLSVPSPQADCLSKADVSAFWPKLAVEAALHG